MPKGTLEDDDFLSLIERTRAWLNARAATPARDPVARQAERRIHERRGLGLTARRKEEAERNHQRRQFLFSYLSQLPRKRLLLWIDGVWLGKTTSAQLEVLVEAVAHQRTENTKCKSPKRRGRPPEKLSVVDQALRSTWQTLRQELITVSRARENHFNPSNRTRERGQRLTDFRRACFQSPIGQRVVRAQLFTTFFNDQALTPGEMAARLMHREFKQYLTVAEQTARAKAATAPGELRRDSLLSQAAKLAASLKALPSPQTLHRKLRGNLL